MPAAENQRLAYRDKFRSLHNEAFQTWFEELARALHPTGDFQSIRKTSGDGALDGFVINSQLVYQVYAPARINELRDSDTAAKIKADFHTAYSTLGGQLKVWVFVHNHPEAKIGQLTAAAISDLKTQNQSIEFSVLDITSLWEKLKDLTDEVLIRFFGNPSVSEFVAAWNRVSKRTKYHLDLVGHQLGGLLHISRPDELTKLHAHIQQHDLVVVCGSSGAGKSAIVKTWFEQQSTTQAQLVWFRAEDFQRTGNKPLAELLDLPCSLAEFFGSSPAPMLAVVVDGLEQCYSREAFHHLKELAEAAAANTLKVTCKIVLTCQSEEWARVQGDLLRYSGSAYNRIGSVTIENFSHAQFLQVVEVFPVLQPLVRRNEIARLLLRPKILDLLVTRLQTRDTSQVARWVGESDFIEWWWCEVIERGQSVSTRGRLVRQLAENLSDRLESEVSADEFRGDELVCAELVHDNICRVVEGRLRFAHDLFGDWARQRQLLSQGSDLKSYLMSRLDCPPWQKALRLLGLHLLERRNDLSDWQLKLADFTDDSHTSKLARDIFLEAAVFAADPVPLLEKLWPELVANDGKLLQRFLKRFLHSATVPDFRVIEYFQKENPDLVIEVAARYRLPYFPFWFSVLSWLHTHLEDVTALAPDEVAEVGRLWLAVADGKLLDRKLAAELVVRNAEKFLPLEMSRNGHLRDTDAKPIYEAALAASGDIPKRIAKLVLKLSGRMALDPSDIPADVEPEYLGKRLKYTGRIIPSDYIEDDPPQPWPEGPKRSISGGFQQAFLHGNAALPLITHQPVVAAEATLALLISWPRTKIRHSP